MSRGNPNLNNNAQARREHTQNLIRQAVKLLEESFEIKSIQAVSDKTKELDINKKGVSVASFRNKSLEHIQALMIELGIGKYEAITLSATEEQAAMADQLLEIKKELNKKNNDLKQMKQKNKKLTEKIDELVDDNDELRTAIYEMELKYNMSIGLMQNNNFI